ADPRRNGYSMHSVLECDRVSVHGIRVQRRSRECSIDPVSQYEIRWLASRDHLPSPCSNSLDNVLPFSAKEPRPSSHMVLSICSSSSFRTRILGSISWANRNNHCQK